MKKDILFSIIIPMYNCEKTIDRAIKSVINQSYTNFELILINDGSKDGTLEKVQAYESCINIKIVSKNNEGVSIARNRGLEIATGDYILFLDADDYYDLKLLENINKILKKNKVDLLKYNYFIITNKGIIKKKHKYSIEVNKILMKDNFSKTVLPYVFSTDDLNPVWNCVIKKEAIKDIIFDKNLITAEDLDFTTSIINNIDSIYIIDLPLIYYVYSNNSVTRTTNLSKSFKKIDSQISSYNKILKKFKIDKSDYHYCNKLNNDFHVLFNDLIICSSNYNDYLYMIKENKNFEKYLPYFNLISNILNIDVYSSLTLSKRKYLYIKFVNKLKNIKRFILNML